MTPFPLAIFFSEIILTRDWGNPSQFFRECEITRFIRFILFASEKPSFKFGKNYNLSRIKSNNKTTPLECIHSHLVLMFTKRGQYPSHPPFGIMIINILYAIFLVPSLLTIC